VVNSLYLKASRQNRHFCQADYGLLANVDNDGQWNHIGIILLEGYALHHHKTTIATIQPLLMMKKQKYIKQHM